MNQHEKYLFDLRGYIVVRNAITPAQINDLSTCLEMHRDEKNPFFGSDRTRFNANEDLAWTVSVAAHQHLRIEVCRRAKSFRPNGSDGQRSRRRPDHP